MKNKSVFFLAVAILALGFTGCGESPDGNNEKEKVSVDTTLKISNQSNYNLMQLNYASVDFGTVESSKEITKNVTEGTRRIFFYLKSITGEVYCRTSEQITCEHGKSNERVISNNTVIENTENGKSGSLKTIYDEINTLPASLELSQGGSIISQFGEHDFGSVLKGKPAEVTFTIRNPGTEPLSLTGDPAVSSSNNIFTVTSQPTNTVNAGSSVYFILSYTPTEDAAVTSTITILNDGDIPAFLFTVKGRGKDYAVGGEGPAGGIIFYDAGSVVNGFRYLEAAPAATEANAEWGTYEINVTGTQTAVGTGKQNTEIIVAALTLAGETGKATQICNNLVYNGFDDWFLPSGDELDYMYKNLKQKLLGGFGSGEYWSSSQRNGLSFDEYYAWHQNFNTGSFGHRDISYKNEAKYVRAIRAFK